jgi:ankyrin repeat protein
MAFHDLSRACLACLVFVLLPPRASGQPAANLPQTFRDPAALELKAAIGASDLDKARRVVSAASKTDCLELDEQGRTALHYAVRACVSDSAGTKAFEILKLLASRPGCINAPDRLGREPILDLAPLSWTSRSRMDALNVLLANGADVNAQDQNGNTLLHQLLRTWDSRWPEVLQILIRAKANPNLTNSAGESTLHAFFGRTGFCTNRQEVGSSNTKLKIAQKVFTMLVGAGADLTLKDTQGTTPIGTLLSDDEPYYGTKEIIIGFLDPAISTQLRISSAEVRGRPALIFLCDHGMADAELILRLMQLGADPKRAEADGFTGLHGAAWFYNSAVCELLLQAGANVNSVNDKGRSALHELARSTYWSSAFFDADRSADILKTADVLVAHGADRHRKDINGKTPLDLLKVNSPSDSDNPEMIRQLRKKLK